MVLAALAIFWFCLAHTKARAQLGSGFGQQCKEDSETIFGFEKQDWSTTPKESDKLRRRFLRLVGNSGSLELKTHFVLASMVILFTQLPVSAADILPPAQTPEKGSGQGPQTTPAQPADPSTPVIPPSSIDPGIERRPPTVPDPRSAVPPPNVDPKMSIDPETAPPAKGMKPGGGTETNAEPRRR